MVGLARARAHSFEKADQALDQARLVDRLAMADNLGFERPHHVADETDAVERAADCNQRRGDGKESISRPYGIEHHPGDGGNRVQGALAFTGDTTMLAVGDDYLRAVDM